MEMFAGMALKLEKVGPTFSSFNPCSLSLSHPGYKRIFSRERVDASVSVVGRQLTETGNRAWNVCGTQGMSILTIRGKRRQETVSVPKSSLEKQN